MLLLVMEKLESLWLWLSLNISRTTQVAVAVAAGLVAIKWVTKKRYKLPPGPRGLPIVGNILELRGGVSLGDKFNEWKEKYGPVFTCYMGPVRLIILNDFESMHEAFVKQGSDFSGRPFLHSLDRLTEGSKDIVFCTYGESWKYQRKIAVQALRQYLTGTQLERRVHETLKPVIDNMLAEKGPFNPHRALSLAVFNVLHGLCFETTLHMDDHVFHELLNVFDMGSEVAGNGFIEDFFPPLRLFPTKKYKTVMEAVDMFNDYVHKRLDEHKASFSADKIESLTDNIILAQQQAMEENDPAICAMFTDTHAAQILADIFGAGVDTSRTTLDWVFLVLAAYPEVQKRIHEELDAVVGDEIPGKEHRHKLVYLEAVLLETMRLHYVVPIGLPHETLRDSHVGGYEIPAKTMIMTNNTMIMRDPRHWDDPLTFKPERFLDETQTKLMTRHKSWIPFSLGHRSCLGESLAKLELVYIIAGLLQKLSFSLPPDTQANFVPHTKGIAYIPERYKVIVSRRRDI